MKGDLGVLHWTVLGCIQISASGGAHRSSVSVYLWVSCGLTERYRWVVVSKLATDVWGESLTHRVKFDCT
jgi:hypothetical protein